MVGLNNIYYNMNLRILNKNYLLCVAYIKRRDKEQYAKRYELPK